MWVEWCENKGKLLKMGTGSPPAPSHYQKLLCLNEQKRKFKPLVKRPPVLLQEKPPEGNRAVASWPLVTPERGRRGAKAIWVLRKLLLCPLARWVWDRLCSPAGSRLKNSSASAVVVSGPSQSYHPSLPPGRAALLRCRYFWGHPPPPALV